MNSTVAIVVVMLCVLCPTALGIGVSPGRWTVDISEDGSRVLPSNALTYTLFRGSTRYSGFSLLNPLDLDASIVGTDVSSGVDVLSNKSFVIDWDDPLLVSRSSITASVEVTTQSPWNPSSIEPGSYRIENLAVHSDLLSSDSGVGAVASVVSQVALWRNYALDGDIVALAECYQLGAPTTFGVNVTDYISYATYMKYLDFGYDVDWESDGICDDSLNGIRMTSETGLAGSLDICSGFMNKELLFSHEYSTPGDYLITLNLRDSIDTTSLEIPVTIVDSCTTVPEPASVQLALLGLCAVVSYGRGMFKRPK